MTYNAEILSTFLGYEDHGMLTSVINLKYDGFHQGFGTYRLDTYNKTLGENVSSIKCGSWIANILRVLKVDSWEKVKGYCRINYDEDSRSITGIGHIIEDLWFYPRTDMDTD